MKTKLLKLVHELSEITARETKLLDALDLPRAGAMVTEKFDALRALQDAYREIAENSEAKAAADDTALREAIETLERRGDANRAAIERGLNLQMRLIQTIVRAVPRARAAAAPVYRADGSQLPPRPPEAYTFVARM
jgi:hypothetical protein